MYMCRQTRIQHTYQVLEFCNITLSKQATTSRDANFFSELASHTLQVAYQTSKTLWIRKHLQEGVFFIHPVG